MFHSNQLFQLPMLVCFCIWSIPSFQVDGSFTRERYMRKAGTPQGTVTPTASANNQRKREDFPMSSNNTEGKLKINHPHPLTVRLMFFAEAHHKSPGNSDKVHPAISINANIGSDGTTEKVIRTSQFSSGNDKDLIDVLRPPPNITKDDWRKIRYKPVVTSTVENATNVAASRRVSGEFQSDRHKLPELSSSVKRSVTSIQIPFNPIRGMLRNVGTDSRTTGVHQRLSNIPSRNTHRSMDPVRRMLALSSNNQQRHGYTMPLATILSNVNRQRGSPKTTTSPPNLHFPENRQGIQHQRRVQLVQSSSNTNSQLGQPMMQHHRIRTGSINRPLFLSQVPVRHKERTETSTIDPTFHVNEGFNQGRSISNNSLTEANPAPDQSGRAIHLVSADDTIPKDNPFRLASLYAQRFEFARAQLRKNMQNSTAEQSVKVNTANPGHHTLQEIYDRPVGNPIFRNHSPINQRTQQSTFRSTPNTERSKTARTYFYVPKSQTQPYQNSESIGTVSDHAPVASYTLNMNRNQPRLTSDSSTKFDKALTNSYTVPITTVNRTSSQNTSRQDFTMPIYHTISLFNRNKERVNAGNTPRNGQVASSVKLNAPTNYAYQRNVSGYTHSRDMNSRSDNISQIRNENPVTVNTASVDSQRHSGAQGIHSEKILQTRDSARASDPPLMMSTYNHEQFADRIPNLSGNNSNNRLSTSRTYQKEELQEPAVVETPRNNGTAYIQSRITTAPNKPQNQTFIRSDQTPYRREPKSSKANLNPVSQPTTPAYDQMSHHVLGGNDMMDLPGSTRQFRPDTSRTSDLGTVRQSHIENTEPSQRDNLRLDKPSFANQSHPHSVQSTHFESSTRPNQGLVESNQHLLRPSNLNSAPQSHFDVVTQSQVDSSAPRQSRVDSMHSLPQDTVGVAASHPKLSDSGHRDSGTYAQQASVSSGPVGLRSLQPDPLPTSQLHSFKSTPPRSDSARPPTLASFDLGSISTDSMRSSNFDSVSQPHLDSATQSYPNLRLQSNVDLARPTRLSNLDSQGNAYDGVAQSSQPRLSHTLPVDSVLPKTTNNQQLHQSQHYQQSQSIYDQFLNGAFESPFSNMQSNLSVISDDTPVSGASHQERVIYSQVRGGRMTERISDLQVVDPPSGITGNSYRRVLSASRHQATPGQDQRIFSGHYQPIIPVNAEKHLNSRALVDSVAPGQYQTSRNPVLGTPHLNPSQHRPSSNLRPGMSISESLTISSNIPQLPPTHSFSNNASPTVHQPHTEPAASGKDDSMLDFLSWLVDAANVHYNISTATTTRSPYSEYPGHNRSPPSPPPPPPPLPPSSSSSSGRVSSHLDRSTLNFLKFIAEFNSSSTTGSEVGPMVNQNTGQQAASIGQIPSTVNRHTIQLPVTTSTTPQSPTTQAYTSTTLNPQETIQRLLAILQQAVAKQKPVASTAVVESSNRTVDELVVKAVNSIVRIQALKSLDCRAVSFLYSISFMEYLPMRCDKSCPALTKCMNVGSIGFCCPVYVTNHMIQMEIMKATTSADNDMLGV